MRLLLALALAAALVAPGAALATHPCFGVDCGIPHGFPPDLSDCRAPPEGVDDAWVCLKGALS